MPEPVVREWRFYMKDMIAFAENVAAYTEGLDQKAFVASGLKKFEPRSLSGFGDRSEPSGRARTDFHDFEVHSGFYVPKNRGNMDRYTTGAVDQS